MIRWIRHLYLVAMEGIRFYFCVCPRFPMQQKRPWWKRWLPSMKYIEFRMHTAYGMKHNWPRPKFRKKLSDIMRFLAWRRRSRLEQKARE